MYTSVLQSAWRIINDTFFRPPCLRLPVITLVCASTQLAENIAIVFPISIEKIKTRTRYKTGIR